jgi:hypothetical protein
VSPVTAIAYFFDPELRTACISSLAIGAAVVPPNPVWFWSVTCDGDLGIVGRSEADEPGRVDPRGAGLRSARLAGDGNPRDRGRAAGSVIDRGDHHRVDLARGLARHHAVELLWLDPDDRVAAESTTRFSTCGSISTPPFRDRGGDHRHLQGRDGEPFLPEGEAAGIDLGRRVRREEEPAAVVEAARKLLVRGSLERRVLVEAELLHVLEDRSGAERLADVAEDRVDRVLETHRKRGVPEGLDRPVGACGVRHLLPVLDAVAGVVEGRFGRELVRIEGRRRGDDLEGRPGCEEAVGRAVQQRRRRVARGRWLS